jgi:hypothetical protein
MRVRKNMRNVIIKLNELYGVENNQNLTIWFNNQLNRLSEFDGGTVSLMDIDEPKIEAAIKRLNACVPLSAEQLIKHTEIITVMNQNQLDLEPAFRFKSSFYRFLLEASGSILVDAFGLVREKDKFERYGHDKHVVHIPNKDEADAPVIMAYINGSSPNLGIQFSVVLNKDEIAGIKETQINNAFNGINPFGDKDWEDVYKAAVIERLYDEDVFASLEVELGENTLNVFKAVKLYNADRYQNAQLTKLKVFSNYGKHIATKKFRFTAADKIEVKRKKVILTLVTDQNNGQEKELAHNDDSEFDDVMKDFGGF